LDAFVAPVRIHHFLGQGVEIGPPVRLDMVDPNIQVFIPRLRSRAHGQQYGKRSKS
jgi:hypothetical protein